MILSSNFGNYYRVYGNEKNPFEKMKQNGYDACDYPLMSRFITSSPYEKLSDELEKETLVVLQREKSLASDAGVKIAQTHAGFYFDLDCYDEEYKKAYIKHTKRQIDLTAFIGCPIMVVHPVQPYGWNEDKEVERTLELNIEILTELSKHAKDCNVILALENMPGLGSVPCTSPESILTMVDTVNSDALKICFDSGHANYAKNFLGENRHLETEDYLRLFSSRIVCLHIHENNGNRDQHNMLNTTPTGGPNWDNIAKALKEIGYHGTFNSEADFSSRLPVELFDDGEKLQAKLFRYYIDKYGL